MTARRHLSTHRTRQWPDQVTSWFLRTCQRLLRCLPLHRRNRLPVVVGKGARRSRPTGLLKSILLKRNRRVGSKISHRPERGHLYLRLRKRVFHHLALLVLLREQQSRRIRVRDDYILWSLRNINHRGTYLSINEQTNKLLRSNLEYICNEEYIFRTNSLAAIAISVSLNGPY